MPVLDTQVLFAMQPSDGKHERALELLASTKRLTVPDTSLFEFLAVLRGRGKSNGAIKQIVLALGEVLRERDVAGVATMGPLLIASQCEVESEYGLSFFDSLIAASALATDGVVVSDDRAFDKVPGLKRVALGSREDQHL